MTDLTYNGKPMTFDPINMDVERMIQLLHQGTPQVVNLEPGDATRYDLLLLPLNLDVGLYLGNHGIEPHTYGGYLFVSWLSDEVCPGTWVPFSVDMMVDVWDVAGLSNNGWSRQLLAWWLTSLNKLL